jgi:hypothetical protein
MELVSRPAHYSPALCQFLRVRLSSPFAMAQRWLAAKIGLNKKEKQCSQNFSTRTRQTKTTSTQEPFC